MTRKRANDPTIVGAGVAGMSGGTKLPLPTEREVQRAILKMAGLCFPRVFIHHSPNGAFLGSARDKAIRGGVMKGDGTKAGFPDLICIWPAAHIAFIEVKRPKSGTLSDNQKAVHQRLRELHCPLAVVTSVDEAFEFLKGLGAPWSGSHPQ